MMTEDQTNSFQTIDEFAAVAQRLSFRAAAAELGIDLTVLSRRIARLEARLGVRLLHRTTRKVTLTEAGALYQRRCDDLLSRLSDAQAEVSRYAAGPTGTLRLALPNVFGQKHIAPLIPDFMALYPDLRIELTFTDRMSDLLDENLDAAVRIGALQAGGDLRIRNLAPNNRTMCAAPEYLSTHGEPTNPRSFSPPHPALFAPVGREQLESKRPGGGALEVVVSPVLRADNVEVLRLAALAGQGIATLADFIAADDLRAGRLVAVLSDWKLPPSTISIVYPNAPFMPQKVRAICDFLAGRFGATLSERLATER